MKTGDKKQLRSCSAHVRYFDELVIYDMEGTKHQIFNAYVLISYSTPVSIFGRNRYDEKRLFMMPKWECSQTTKEHVRKFTKDYSGYAHTVGMLREELKGSMFPFHEYYVRLIKDYKVIR